MEYQFATLLIYSEAPAENGNADTLSMMDWVTMTFVTEGEDEV